MAKPRLHLDADTSNKALYKALNDRGLDVSRTPNEWMPADADDDAQLLGASMHGRCIFTFNVRDFALLACKYPQHGGIVLATQQWPLAALIDALHGLLSETQADEWPGRTCWLNDWLKDKKRPRKGAP